MAELGVKEGDLVEVYNDEGSTQAMVYPTPTARKGETFMLFAYPTGVQGNVINDGINELILPNYKQTWANIRKIADAPEGVRHLTFKSQEYSWLRAATMKPVLIDPFGRHVTYLRVSVTDRCDFRCVYCMAEDMTFLPKKDLLTLEELDRVCDRLHRAAGCGSSGSPAASRWCGANIMALVEIAVAAFALGRARRTDAHHQWQPARPLCRGAR